MFLSAALVLALQAQGSEWKTDAASGCQVWNVAQNVTAVSWAGPCMDKKANGTGVLRLILADRNEEKFEGTLNAGKSAHGLEAVEWWKKGEIEKIIKKLWIIVQLSFTIVLKIPIHLIQIKNPNIFPIRIVNFIR